MIHLAPSLAKNETTCETSSGCPILAAAAVKAVLLFSSGPLTSSGIIFKMSVATTPGATAIDIH